MVHDMPQGSRRVLILTASYGSGHAHAAGVLADEFRRAGALPTVVDHFRDLVHPAFDQASRACYYAILRRAPALWGGAYWAGDQISISSPFLLGFNRLGARKLRRLLRAQRFDHVVSVQPTPAAALSYLRSRGESTPPHTTVFTDFVAHTQWIHPHLDRYCVPAEEIAHELMAKGLPRESVVVTGIPVGREFHQESERASARLALGLSPRLPVLLFMDGAGGGFGRLEEAARAVLGMEQPFQAVFVAGHERALEGRLKRLADGRENRVKVFGFVDHIRQIMAAADFLVTKAGGLTLAEALAAELPIICFGSLPGQEARNERFAAMTGIGLVAGSGAQLQRVIVAALRDPVLLRDIRERIRLYRRPRAAEDIVGLVLGDQRQARERAS
jgi:processive 1,2-diacylglycerol beta-glucosyltransferase